jgi:hypothetical protein
VIHLLAHIGSTHNRPEISKHIDQCVYRCVKLSDSVFVIFDIMVTQKKVNPMLSGAHLVLCVYDKEFRVATCCKYNNIVYDS